MAIYGDGKHDNGVVVTKKKKYIRRKSVGVDKPFQITSVCKADIISLIQDGKINSFTEKDVLKLTELDMKRIASKLADDYCEQLFWTSLEIISDYIINDKRKINNYGKSGMVHG